MGAERWDEQVGSVADEAARLLESLRRTAADATDASAADASAADAAAADARAGAAAPDAVPETHGEPPGSPGGDASAGCTDPFCQWCPLCRTSAVVRSLSPETLARLADLAGVAAAVLADLASARSPATGSPSAAPVATPAPEDARAGRARPIPVRDADDPQEEPRG
ncbi:hypothetical protein [Oryzobacter terrae]|uniref:hypothetical protein n=1 Tax=Oryzobacter terrae TaxID=1620385 RepID=UPI00366EDCBD